MGWTFTPGLERSALQYFIRNTIEKQETENMIFETIAHCRRGTNLWTVMQSTNKKTNEIVKFVVLYLLSWNKENGWGYKDIDEGMGPCEINCPISYLNMTEDQKHNQYSTEWRKRVREYYDNKRTSISNLKNKFNNKGNGKCILSLKGSTVDEVEIITIGKRIQGKYNGFIYTIPRRMIGEARIQS
jgi:hypothetical protein